MKLKVFSVPSSGDEQAEASLNHFLASHRIAQIDRQLVSAGAGSHWSVCIGYWDVLESPTRNRKAQIDYREVLSDIHFREYAALREWRKRTAESEGVQAYTIFTNEQLANIVRLESANLAAVGTIDGIGKGKLEQYASLVLDELMKHRQASGATNA